jgi:predicted ATPase/DNA-binding SARP family transcriptional activator
MPGSPGGPAFRPTGHDGQARMLHLLDTPHWRQGESRWDLPDTLPGWTLAFLSVQRDWVARERLCTLIWPDAGVAEAQHSLRVNLYRVRAILAGWGAGTAFEAERKRVRLRLPTDVAAFREVTGVTDPAARLARYRQPFLSAMSLPGFPAFQEWLELERDALQRQWREAALALLSSKSLPTDRAVELCQALMSADPLDDAALTHQLKHLVELGRNAEARQLFQQFRRRVREELASDLSPSLQALGASLAGTPAPARTAPARDAFVGRVVELAQLKTMLGAAEGRILTITGPGGVGKSRLARELVRRIAGDGASAVPWIALADLTAAADALPRLAEQIGLQLAPARDAKAQLAAALAARQGLIVVDNAEHLADLPGLLLELQRASPRSTWLVTSQAPLGLAAERIYALAGMEGPDADEPVEGFEQASSFEAMRLLESRAQALDPEFDLAAHWGACLGLVRAVGGWPLAIELAAGAVTQHGVEAVLAELLLSIDTLATGRSARQGRHESMRASLALSWRLLEPEEASALAALSVFRGGFTRAAALAVGDCSSVTLARLVERSLVQIAGGGRFDLHSLVAQFASERLASDESRRAAVAGRHAEHFAGRLQACAATRAENAAALLQEIAIDFENVRSAWAALVATGDTMRIAGSARALSEFGTARGRTRELKELVAAAMPATSADVAARNALLEAAAILHFRSGELDSAEALAGDALAAATAAGDEAGQRSMLNTRALALKDLGRYEEAERHAGEALQRSRAAGAESEIASHANTCAILAKMRGDNAHAAALYEEAITLHRRSGEQRGLATCLNNLGNVHRALGDSAGAQRCFEEALRACEQHGIASTRSFALINLAIVHQQAGRMALATSFAQRARAEPAAEIAVLLAADVLETMAAIEQQTFGRAQELLGSLARRARQTGHHAALLEAVNCHAKLLAALGRRGDAIARFLYLIGHPQVPDMQRSDTQQALDGLAATADERSRAAAVAARFELELLVEDAAAAPAPPQ